MRRAGLTATGDFAAAAGRCPDRPGIIDECGTVSCKLRPDTSFAGPAMVEVVDREGADVVIYDQDFTESVEPLWVNLCKSRISTRKISRGSNGKILRNDLQAI